MTLHPGRISTALSSGACHCLCLGVAITEDFVFLGKNVAQESHPIAEEYLPLVFHVSSVAYL